jgi:hypothetical protein
MTTSDATSETVKVQGVEVPKLGFGTFRLPGADCREGVRDALEIGYRHIDWRRSSRCATRARRARSG